MNTLRNILGLCLIVAFMKTALNIGDFKESPVNQSTAYSGRYDDAYRQIWIINHEGYRYVLMTTDKVTEEFAEDLEALRDIKAHEDRLTLSSDWKANVEIINNNMPKYVKVGLVASDKTTVYIDNIFPFE